MKFYLLIALLIPSLSLASTTCSDEAIELLSLATHHLLPGESQQTAEMKACVAAKKGFDEILGQICLSKTELNADYKRFKDYALKYVQLKRQYESAGTPGEREYYGEDLLALDSQWIALGKKHELFSPLSSLSKLIESCN